MSMLAPAGTQDLIDLGTEAPDSEAVFKDFADEDENALPPGFVARLQNEKHSSPFHSEEEDNTTTPGPLRRPVRVYYDMPKAENIMGEIVITEKTTLAGVRRMIREVRIVIATLLTLPFCSSHSWLLCFTLLLQPSGKPHTVIL